MSCVEIKIQTSVPGSGTSGGCCSGCGQTLCCCNATTADFITADGFRYYNDERIAGLIDGVNREFSIANRAVDGTLQLFINGGRRLERSLDFDYLGNKITLNFAPMPATTIFREDTIIAAYFSEKECC